MRYKDRSLILIKRHSETTDTESFYFKSKKTCFFKFKPGQFALVEININGIVYVRAYSISSQPTSCILKLTIKRVVNGIVSNWLIDNLKVNDEIKIHGITGEFNIIDIPYHSQVLFISAGCGITPVFSMAYYLLGKDPSLTINFLHCAKDNNNIIYYKNIKELKTNYLHFNYHIRLKNYTPQNNIQNSSSGRLTSDFLLTVYPDLHKYTIFLCGSQYFMEDVITILQSIQFNMTQFHHENFTTRNYQELSNDKSLLVNVTVPKFGFNQKVSIDDNLLTILEAGQLPIIGACRAGVCGSCKCKIDKGEVESTSTATLTPQEIEQGYRLACSTTVKSDIQVSL